MLQVRIPAGLRSSCCARLRAATSPSKRRMRPAPHAGLRAGSLNVVCLHSPFDGSEGFLFLPQRFFPPALVSVKPSRGVVPRDKAQIRKMKKISLFVLALASLVINSHAAKTNFAARVVSYDPGLGFADG